ncbi:fibroblast growth factor 1 isoform X2 [Balaenoptera musculus]|uniref:Fibroblast growth factor n=2 Tax=Cetacea TaxID=9721 RepID=A0A8B8X2M1_BALMU|nr:fibroblast growth factor 1 isoform X2 [Balaenoptera musculus]
MDARLKHSCTPFSHSEASLLPERTGAAATGRFRESAWGCRGSSCSAVTVTPQSGRDQVDPLSLRPEKPSACRLFSLESAITRSCSAMAEGEITTFTALTEKFNLPPGNYKKPKLLYCSNGGHFLRILPDGTVDGTRDRSDQHIQLQLSAESVGEVYIKSTETGQYLAMDTDGLLYGSTPNEECLFLERLEENHYNTYASKKHAEKNWFVGLKKNGSCKRGPRTHYGQKAILFLPLPVSSD